jgi:dynein heavy chain
VIEATSILLKLKAKKVTIEGKTKDDYSDEIKKQLVSPNMVKDLKTYDKENIPPQLIQKIKPYIDDSQFDPAVIITKSKACAGLCMWVHAMYKYHFINLEVIPLRIEQKKANEEL